MIGIALADWLLNQQPHERLGERLDRGAEQFEQLSLRGGLTETVDSDDSPRAPDILVPEVTRPLLDSNAR